MLVPYSFDVVQSLASIQVTVVAQTLASRPSQRTDLGGNHLSNIINVLAGITGITCINIMHSLDSLVSLLCSPLMGVSFLLRGFWNAVGTLVDVFFCEETISAGPKRRAARFQTVLVQHGIPRSFGSVRPVRFGFFFLPDMFLELVGTASRSFSIVFSHALQVSNYLS